MTKITRGLQILLVASTIALPSTACSTDDGDAPNWLLGTLDKTSDEDGGPPDSITFKSSGIFVTYDSQCNEHTNSYFVGKGMVFLVIPLAKGPVALVLNPSSDRLSMTFTSPRTQKMPFMKLQDGPYYVRTGILEGRSGSYRLIL